MEGCVFREYFFRRDAGGSEVCARQCGSAEQRKLGGRPIYCVFGVCLTQASVWGETLAMEVKVK